MSAMNSGNLSLLSPRYTTTNSNITPSTTTPCLLTKEDIVLVTGYAMVILVGVAGNALVLLVFSPRWKRGPIIDLLILYLALFDLLASIFGPFVFLYWLITCDRRWHFGSIGCKILSTLCRIFTDISIGVILIMAIDRCRAIVTPLKERFCRHKIHLAVAIAVILSVLCESYYINAVFINNRGLCSVLSVNDPIYSYPLIVLTIVRNVAFITIFSITTISVYVKLYNSNNSRLLRTNSRRQRCLRSAQVIKMLVIMAVVFAVAVIPRDIFHLAYTISWMIPHSQGINYT